MPKAGTNDAHTLRNLIIGSYKAFESFDLENLAPFYAKDRVVVIFNDVEPVKFEGWDAFKKGEEEIMAGVSTWKVTQKDIRVSTWKRVALTTATPVMSGKMKTGRRFKANLRHTAVWEKKGDRGLIIHEHWSIPWPHS